MRTLILTGGIRHDFDDNTAALAEQLADAGFRCETETDIEAGTALLRTEAYDLVTVMALRWRMLGDEKYAPYRAKWGYSPSRDARAALRAFVSGGGGLFGFHTACLCFDDWPEWREILGGAWAWGRSFHPPFGPVRIAATDTSHPITRGIAAFDLDDEVYSGLTTVAGIKPLLVAQSQNATTMEPVLWVHQYGSGRVIFDALGHNRASIEQSEHSAIIKKCALWAAGSDSL